MGKIIPLLFVIRLLFLSVETSGKKKPTVDFWPVEESIQQLFRDIRETDDSLAIGLHRQIEDLLVKTLIIPEAYKHKFDSLKMIGRINAPRKEFRIFNWNHSSLDGTYRYFALIVFPGKNNEPNRVIRLTETTDSIARPDQKILSQNQWLGCLYYKIVPKRKGKDGNHYYTLLGLDMNNLQTKKKYIEILSFDADGTPQLGAPILELNKWPKHRVIFEFSASRSMYLEYNRFRRRIEFDHLAPLMPYLVGQYEYYEPDEFRDALKFKRGQWKYIKDIETPKDKKFKKSSLPKPPRHLPKQEPLKQGTIDEPEDEEEDETP